ncbi:hypothetical protein ACFV1N_20315 [Streptosporangium canum]|uniref:hypothetical protein n=1 Tax=Streptosporangium canum TaxID=324952 RepID=UPI00369BFA61
MSHPPRRRLGITLLATLTLTTCLYGQHMAHAEPEKSTAAVQTPDDLTLWYDKPATDWETRTPPPGLPRPGGGMPSLDSPAHP